MTWQPISTAPEGEDVLLCIPRHGCNPPGNLLPPEMAVGTLALDGCWYSDSAEDQKEEYKLHSPTHWMPLPEPPEGTEA